MPKKSRKGRAMPGARPPGQAVPGRVSRSSKPDSDLARRHQYVLSDLRRSAVIAVVLCLGLMALYFLLR